MRAVTYANTKEMIRNNYSEETNLEKLQQAQVFFRDAYNYLCRFEELCLTKDSLERGFIVQVVDSAAKGFVPRDFHMLHNISYRIEEIEKRLNELYASLAHDELKNEKKKRLFQGRKEPGSKKKALNHQIQSAELKTETSPFPKAATKETAR